jgi:hypothetical protein
MYYRYIYTDDELFNVRRLTERGIELRKQPKYIYIDCSGQRTCLACADSSSIEHTNEYMLLVQTAVVLNTPMNI